jgi:hypothetical protein
LVFCEALTEFPNNGEISGSLSELYRLVGGGGKERQVGPVVPVVRLFMVEVALDKKLGNKYQFIKPIY